MSLEMAGGNRLSRIPPLRGMIAVAVVAVLILIFNGGIDVGFGNHAVLLPVVRQMLDPDYLPGDFGIALRWYHHRAFLLLIAGLASQMGEDAAMVGLAIAGKVFLSAALYVLCRSLGLSRRAFLLAGMFLAAGILWTGQGLEQNTFVGAPTVMPPIFAHGLMLLVVSGLIRQRWVLAAFLTGLTFLVHMQIGFVFGLVILPFFAGLMRRQSVNWRTGLAALLAALLPSLPALGWLAVLLQQGLASSTNSLALIDFRMPHHFEILSPTRVLAVGAHLVVMAAVYRWMGRNQSDNARGVGLMFGISVTILIGTILHLLDYYYVRHGAVAKLQFIRLTPGVTVFGTLAGLVFLERWTAQPARRGGRAALLSYALVLVAAAGWVGVRWDSRAWDGLTVQKYAESTAPWVEICRWIRLNGPREAVYLTPPGQEGFTYLADRSNVAEFKNNPDGGFFVDEWLTRMRDLTNGDLPGRGGFRNRALLNRSFAQLDENQLIHLSHKYRAEFAVVPTESSIRFEALYQNPQFRLVRIPSLQHQTADFHQQ